MLLAALAYGAGRVVVACGPQDPPTIRQAVEWQTRMAGAILQGLGMPEEKSGLPSARRKTAIPRKRFPSRPNVMRHRRNHPLPPPAFPPDQDKRTLVRLATQHLC